MTARESHPESTKTPVAKAAVVREPLAPHVALPWIIQLRFLLVAGEIALLTFAADPPDAGDRWFADRWLWCGVAVAAQLAAAFWLTRRKQRADEAGSEHALGSVFVLDVLALTTVFAFTGGPTNPYTLLYLVQITLSAVILDRSWTWVLGVVSTICYGSLFLFPTAGSMHAAGPAAEMMARHVTGMWVAFALAAGAITFFIGQVSETLQRRRSEVLELQRQAAGQERLASLVTLAAGAAHEMGTPLGTIAIAAREIERTADADTAEDAQLIRSQVERCRDILAEMSANGAEPPGEAPRRVRVEELTAALLERLPAEAARRVDIDEAGAAIELRTFPASVVQSLVALVRNGLDASDPDGRVRVSAEAAEDVVTFTVRDSGEGMDAATLAHVTEPFFTRKPAGKGMGLGAFLAHLFATRIGGGLQYESEVGRGTVAYLQLPQSGTVR